MAIAANIPKRPLESATSFALYSLHSRATLRAPASSRNLMAGVVIEGIAGATPALSMSAIDFSGVQSRTGPEMFLAVIAATYGGGGGGWGGASLWAWGVAI